VHRTGASSAEHSARRLARSRHLLAGFDVAAATTALLLTTVLVRVHVRGLRPQAAHVVLFTVVVVILGLLLVRQGHYSGERRISRLSDTVLLVRNALIAYLLAIGLAFASDGFFTGYMTYSHLVVVANLVLLLTFMLAARYTLYARQQTLFERGQAVRKLLVVGTGQAGHEFVRFLENRPWLGVRAAGVLSLDKGGAHALTGDTWMVPHVGHVSEIKTLFTAHGADQVVVALDPREHGALPQVTEALVAAEVPFKVVPSLFEESFRAAQLAGFTELPVLEMRVDPLDRAQALFKRSLDVLVAAIALTLSAPLMALAALLIKLTSPGPVLFRQTRVGKNGRHFTMLKFRTMVDGAEERLAEVLELNEAQGHMFKVRDDPRVTRIGRLLRRWSFDEFPQFWNVLRGEMSVVGPRPPLPREVENYDTMHFSRLKGRPGITGLWQVSGRSSFSFDDMVRLDRYYLENWSLTLDITILLKTVLVVLRRDGSV